MPVRYGRKKLDADAYEKQQKAKTSSAREATKFGKRKQDGPAAVAADPAVNPFRAGETHGDASIGQLRKVLTAKPGLLDAAIESEFMRATVPSLKIRKGALELFLEIEAERKGGPRTAVVDRIETARAALTAPQA